MELDTFEVVFLDDDKVTVLDRQFVSARANVKYKGKEPVKEPTSQETYIFSGWIGEEKLINVNEKLVLIAKYKVDVKKAVKDAMINASLNNVKESNLNETIEAGKKLDSQQKAIEKDSRTTSEIVNDILKNGKTEVGKEVSKENIEK